jgi:putative FmdB family regulatory protein
MPQYDFLCQSCRKLFSKILTLPDYQRGEIICPYCGSEEVEHGRWVPFHAVTSKKSA